MKSFLNIEFATLRGYRSLRLDLHVPEESAAAAVVLFIHGGGFNGGTKDDGPAMDALAKGIAVASVEHRLSSEVKMPAPVHDVKGAVRWLRAHAGEFQLDPTPIAVWGSSSGGHLAALLATTAGVAELEGDVGENTDHASRVQAAVIWAGVTDANLLEGEPRRLFELALGEPIEGAHERVSALNPATYASVDAPPTLIVHSRNDPQVPYRSGELLKDALVGVGVEATLQSVDSDVHGSRLATIPGVSERSIDFLVSHLVAQPAASPA